ncbi:unnamed protein product [Phytophthora fragariaefolia]|uniref:Unnamed protein product n=2 Tax=Phytophthora TaxID=4783 RepID=A0A9W7D468_9STRA|nr:unnamed protein product [Phytophthora fragariaefolia]
MNSVLVFHGIAVPEEMLSTVYLMLRFSIFTQYRSNTRKISTYTPGVVHMKMVARRYTVYMYFIQSSALYVSYWSKVSNKKTKRHYSSRAARPGKWYEGLASSSRANAPPTDPSPPCIHPIIRQLFYSFFKTLVGKEVAVELKNDVALMGVLDSVDQYLNIKLLNVSVVEGDKFPQLMNMKNCFIRGSSIRYVQIPAGEVDTELLQDAARREATANKQT